MTVARLMAAADFSGNPRASVRNGTRKMPPPRPSAIPSAPATPPATKMVSVRLGFRRFRGFYCARREAYKKVRAITATAWL
jgi:hypothetical protein